MINRIFLNTLIKALILINIFEIILLKAFNFEKLFFVEKINIIKKKIENINKKNRLLISKIKFKKNIKKFINSIFREKS